MKDDGLQLDINIGDIGVDDLDIDLDMFDVRHRRRWNTRAT